ncbi:beta-ketoacyl synthase N-terminal-like domain-containing protein [Actinomadura sp. DC4]|uniref:beta-ketoacyl synthase N-terminal-like domain-containing protein n=1 Tax=Actinomadura sp. DC4 TaxID=3055069 RepID=UPI0025B0D75D|nr:beta-ketoacyl synthase N-terminal-like domain-containing protein [Actinomadura sp. DC4]MDN3356374.1 beta-ketoacyl synthase N-terminal-like domain-containing protein [Actinomadura sp. DC4]
MSEDVAIVGIGAVFPGAGDAPAFWDNIRTGVDSVTEVPARRWDQDVYYAPEAPAAPDRFYCRRGGFVDELADFDPTRFGIMPAAVDGTEPDQLLALRAAAEAIADAGGDDRLPDRSRVGVIIGRGGYLTPGVARLDQRVHTAHQLTAVLRDLVPALGEDRLDAVREAFQKTLGPEESIGLVPNFAASRVANRFDLRGPAYTVDAACASSLLAVDHAVRDLASGRCDAVLAGGVHHCHHTTLWSVFTQLRALSPTETIRPFDARADGTLLSEGTGIVLLKRLADALAAGDRVYAVIRGVGVASDGRATSMMNPLSEGQVTAVEQAWRAAGVDPAGGHAVGLVEAHGTATPAGDTVELETLRRVFGTAGPPVGLGTVKSMIGHTMPAAGVAGLIKAALALHHETLPPTLHVEEPHPGLAGTRFTPVAEAVPWERPPGTPRRAAVNAFGFGGINAHVVLEEAPRPARGTVSRSPSGVRPAGEPVLRLAGAGPEDIARALDAGDAELVARAGRPPGDGPCRLAIVAPDRRRLALARKIVARGSPWRGRSDVWFTPRPLLTGPGQVAFLFPGFEAEFAPRVEGLAHHFGLPVPGLSGGGDVVEHAIDVVAVSRLYAAALARLGVVPGALAGHSLGEWTAMVVGGVYPEVDGFIASMRPGMVEVPDVVYAAFGAPADLVAAALDGFDDVHLTHDNCPHQSVICGPAGRVGRIVERLRRQGVMTQTMPFRTGFHSPVFARHLDVARELLGRLEVSRPSVPVWSATSLAPFPPNAGEVRDLVLRHLVEPVRFRRLTTLLYESGIRAFVQVGQGSLVGFTEDTLRDHEHLAIATAVSARDGLDQMRRVAAALWAEGLAPDFGALPAPPAPARAGGTVRLRLGEPMVRLPGLDALVGVPAAGAYEVAGGSPVVAALNAALADTAAAARTITDALHARPAPEPPRTLTRTRVFSLATMPDCVDHCVFPQAPGWPDMTDRFPVVPLTTMLELMAGAAAELAPGATVTGISQVKAARWLSVAPETTTAVHAARGDAGPDGEITVKVRIEGYASGVVHLSATGHPPAPEPSRQALTNPRPAPVTAPELYDGDWMFHGPRFAGVARLDSVGDDGITGILANLPAEGALLDSAGQLIGHWMQVSRTADQTVLPTGVRAVRFYGPRPPAGARLECSAWIREITETEMRADAEIRDGDGRVWCRMEGWTTRRFATDDRTWRIKFRPQSETVSEPRPGGWCVVRERWPDTGSRELIMRRYLCAAERPRYEELTPNTRRAWLLGRIAAKDAVRHRLWDLGAGPIYPAEIRIDNDDRGRPRATGAFRAPHISLAHCAGRGRSPGIAVALAGPGAVGIDIEAVRERDAGTEEIALTAAERALLGGLTGGERAALFTRLWTAKEAAAKAAGTGLGGRPHAFEVQAGEDLTLVVTAPGGTTYRVETTTITDDATEYAVAWTHGRDAT